MVGEKGGRPKPVPGWQGEDTWEERASTQAGRSKDTSSSGRSRVFATQRHCRVEVGVAIASRRGRGGIHKRRRQILSRREANCGLSVDDASMLVLKVATGGPLRRAAPTRLKRSRISGRPWWVDNPPVGRPKPCGKTTLPTIAHV